MVRLFIFSLVLAACGSPGGGPRRAAPIGPASTAPAPATAPPSFDLAAAMKFNLDRINVYRAEANVPPLVLDATLSAAAADGNLEFSGGGPPHGHFRVHRAEIKASVGASFVRETQGKHSDGASEHADVNQFVQGEIERLLAGMMGEGSGGGHHDTILNPGARRLGVAVTIVGPRLYLTNDFSD